MGTGGTSRTVKKPGREANHSPPSSAEVKECVELYLQSPNAPSWSSAQLKKAQGQLYFLTFTPMLTLYSHLCLSVPSGRFPSDFTTKVLSVENLT